MRNLAIFGAVVLSLAAAQAMPAQSAPQSLTEPQARSLAMQSGCSNMSRLSMGQSGRWFGQCQKGGETVNIMVDPSGKVSRGRSSHVTSAVARAELMEHGCSNVSQLSADPSGNWHGTCTKGGDTVAVTVNQQGKIATN